MKDFENMPYTESMRRKYLDGWYARWKSDVHRVGSRHMYAIIRHVFLRFEGKHVNKAFTYYCSLVPKYMQDYFWNEFNTDKKISWRWRNTGFYIDRGSNIRKQKKEFKEKKYEYVNLKTFKEIKFIYENKSNSKYGRKLPPKEITEHFESFDKRYPEGSKGFKRIQYEREKQYRVANRYRQAENDAKIYDLLTYKKKKKANKEDDRIRDSHGFDENSFFGIEYHGRKRKRDKKKNKKI